MNAIKNINNISQKLLKALVQDTPCLLTKILLKTELENPSYLLQATGGFSLKINSKCNSFLKHVDRESFVNYEDYRKFLLNTLRYWVNLQLDNHVLARHYFQHTLIQNLSGDINTADINSCVEFLKNTLTYSERIDLNYALEEFIESDKEITILFSSFTESNTYCLLSYQLNLKDESVNGLYTKRIFKEFEEEISQQAKEVETFSAEKKNKKSYDFTVSIKVDIS